MEKILVKAFSLVLILILGNIIKRLGWVNANDFPKFSKIVLRITLPCALITSFNDFELSGKLFFLIIIGFGANSILELTGYLINRRKGGVEKAFGIINLASYNIGAFSMPYISGFIGLESIIYASFFDIGNSFSAAGTGYGWAMSVAREREKTTALLFIKNMLLSPVFDTYLFLMVMRLLGLRLPDPVIAFTSTVGNANPFMAMLMIGIGLELHLSRKKFRTAFKYLWIRYFYAFLFSIIVGLLLPLPHEIKTILCMLFFAPIAAMSSGFTGDTGGDVETSTFMTSVSILIGIVALPLIYGIMG